MGNDDIRIEVTIKINGTAKTAHKAMAGSIADEIIVENVARLVEPVAANVLSQVRGRNILTVTPEPEAPEPEPEEPSLEPEPEPQAPAKAAPKKRAAKPKK